MDKNKTINQTKAWLNNVIVKHNICPFAGNEVKRDRIRYAVIVQSHISQCLEYLLNEFEILDTDSKVETTLLIYPDMFSHFDDYLDYADLANALIVDHNYEGVYQLATFHPDYCFESSDLNDPANYTNRSPYPMLHIIREHSLEQALMHYPNPENIPLNNIALTRKLGLEKMKSMLQDCYDNKNDGDNK